MKQKGTEPVGEFLSRLVSLASIKNIPEKVLLSVAMNGLRSDIKTYVVTQNPKTMEQLRQIAILAEKSQPSQITTLETYENLLSEIKNLKEKIETKTEVNEINRVMPQTHDYSPQFVTQQPPVFQQRVRFHSPPQQAPIYRPRRQTIRLNRSRTVRYALPDVNITPNTQQQSTQHPRMIAPQCYFCLGMCMDRSRCPARNALCHTCNRVGHFSRACRQSYVVQQ